MVATRCSTARNRVAAERLELPGRQNSAGKKQARERRRREDFDEALTNLRQAEQLQEAILKRRPDDAFYQRELMIFYGKIAVVWEDCYFHRQDVKAARDYYMKAAEIA